MAIYKPLVSVGGFAFPDPSKYTANTATIVNTARNAQGYMVGAVIRNDVAKITLSWRFISVSDWAMILQQFQTTFTRSVEFFCQTSGIWETREMYVSDRSAEIFKRDEDNNIIGYLNAKLSLIEV
jgi:hypothetical protein